MPSFPEYPADYLAWLASLKRFKRLSAHQHPNCPYVITFDSRVQMESHKPGMTHQSSFTLLPQAVANSVNWRRLVAAHLRSIRFGCRRHTNPRSVIGVKPPQLPWPQ